MDVFQQGHLEGFRCGGICARAHTHTLSTLRGTHAVVVASESRPLRAKTCYQVKRWTVQGHYGTESRAGGSSFGHDNRMEVKDGEERLVATN